MHTHEHTFGKNVCFGIISRGEVNCVATVKAAFFGVWFRLHTFLFVRGLFMEEFKVGIRYKMKYIRKLHHLKQHQVAEIFGITRDCLAKYETTVCPPARFIFLFCKHFNVSADDLLDPDISLETFKEKYQNI